MAIKAVCFDFGGVLVRTANQAGRIAWEKKLDLEPGALSSIVFDSEAAKKATIGVLPETAVWESVAAELHLDREATDQLHTDFFSGDYLDNRLVEFLSCLRPRYKTAILSNAWPNARQLFTDTFHLDQAVDRLVISAEEGLAKPGAAFFMRACHYLEVIPDEMIFVDDFPANVRGAQDVGIHAYLFTDTVRLINELEKVLY